MQTRLRLLMGATALLYIGPLLAGLAGHGWLMVPVFTAIFVLWLFIMRPSNWPRDPHAWEKSDTWIRATAQTAAQALLVAVCMAIGSGMAGIAALNVSMPTMLPLIISFMALPISRLIWDPSDETRFGGLVNEALGKIGVPTVLSDEAEIELADELTAPLAKLPDSTKPSVVENHLRAMSDHVGARPLLKSLTSQIKSSDAPMATRIAFILRATDPAQVLRDMPIPAPAQAFALAKGDHGLMELFLTRSLPLMRQHKTLWSSFPQAEDIVSATGEHANHAGPLLELADLIEKAKPRRVAR
ncbi:hypothetical protein [Neogemmobacter tilapiae]|uniref:Uncharacterized protein n=1 Tax=Neogemmobacter tilapiae TaxID=875041 RepID=A0A918TVJ3_9RHOB|nr:hypothetical protein [Gemmobacter tilapiae]GHC63226.1 hypothetical protein GCM10007315_29250 [Gemmobacter tilapiae]